MPFRPPLSATADLVRRLDRERFVSSLFAPSTRRDDLLALYALNIELSRIREVAPEPIAGLLRLQWWRQTLLSDTAVEADRHPLAGPARQVILRHHLPEAEIDALLIWRERDYETEPPADLAAAVALAETGPAGLAGLALRVLAPAATETEHEAAAAVGAAWGVIGHLRALSYHRAIGRRTLPDLNGDRDLIALTREMAELAARHLARARQHPVGRAALPVLIPALQADAHLAALRRANWNPLSPALEVRRPRPLALAWAVRRGRF